MQQKTPETKSNECAVRPEEHRTVWHEKRWLWLDGYAAIHE